MLGGTTRLQQKLDDYGPNPSEHAHGRALTVDDFWRVQAIIDAGEIIASDPEVTVLLTQDGWCKLALATPDAARVLIDSLYPVDERQIESLSEVIACGRSLALHGTETMLNEWLARAGQIASRAPTGKPAPGCSGRAWRLSGHP